MSSDRDGLLRVDDAVAGTHEGAQWRAVVEPWNLLELRHEGGPVKEGGELPTGRQFGWFSGIGLLGAMNLWRFGSSSANSCAIVAALPLLTIETEIRSIEPIGPTVMAWFALTASRGPLRRQV